MSQELLQALAATLSGELSLHAASERTHVGNQEMRTKEVQQKSN